MERKGITRILTGMLFLSPLISDAWRYGTYTKEFRGNWPLTEDAKKLKVEGTEELVFKDYKTEEDVLEGVASEELDNAGFQAIKPDTYDEGKEYWKMKDISAEMLKPFDSKAEEAFAKGPTYECMRNPMVCISRDKDPQKCVKKVHFYDLTDTSGTPSAFQTVRYFKSDEEDADPPETFKEDDNQFYALLAPTLYCSIDYSKVIPVMDGTPEAFYEGGEFPEDKKTQRETQCFNVRGDAQLFIDFGTTKETWAEAGDEPIQVHCAMIVYQMPKDPKDGKKWWLHTGPAIFGPEQEALKPANGAVIARKYTAIIEQMNGVEILTAENATKLETSAVALGLGNDRVGFLSDCGSTFYDEGEGKSCDHSTVYDYHNIEVTAEHGATIRTRVFVTEEGHKIAFDTFHVILPHATGWALQQQMFMNGDRLALNDAGKELAAVVGDLEAIQKRANETKDISVPEKFGFAIKCVEKFRNGEKISFDEVSDTGGGGEGAGGTGSGSSGSTGGGGDEDKSFEDQVKDVLAKFLATDAKAKPKEGMSFEDAAKAIGLDDCKSMSDVMNKVKDVNGPLKEDPMTHLVPPRKISREIEEQLIAYVNCKVQLAKYETEMNDIKKNSALSGLQKNLKKLGLTVAEPKKKKKDDDKKEEQIWTEDELPGKYAALKKECDEFLENLPDSKFKTAALTVAWGSKHKEMGPGGEVDVPDNLEALLKDKADAKALYDGDFKKHFELYNECCSEMYEVTTIIDGKIKVPFPTDGTKSTQQWMLEKIQHKLQEIRKLLGIAGEEKKDDEKKDKEALIAKLREDITNLQNEVNDELSEIQGLTDNWTQAEKDILAAEKVKGDVGNQLKAKLYKLYHEAIKAAETAKDTNVGEAQKKLDEAKQYYGAIQALIKDVKEGGCDLTKLTGAWENKEWAKEDIEAGIKAVKVALSALCGTIPEVKKVLDSGEAEAGSKAMDRGKICALLDQLQAIKEEKHRALLEACFNAFERLISAQMTKNNAKYTPEEKKKKMKIKLGAAQIAFQLVISGGSNPDKLPDELKPLQDKLQKIYNDLAAKTVTLDEGTKKLEEDGMIPTEKQKDLGTLKEQIKTNKLNLLTLKILIRGMSAKNSGDGKVCGIVVGDDEGKKEFQGNTEGAQTILKDLQTASEEVKKEEIKKSIEAAKKEMEDFANDLKDYEDFAKVLGEINWESDDVDGQIATQAGENKELEAQLKLYQQYLAALKSAEEKKDTHDEAQKELDKAKQHLTDLRNQLVASYFPKGNSEWTGNQPTDYENLIKWYQEKVEWLSAIEEKARDTWGDSPSKDYESALTQAKTDLQKCRKGIVELSKATQTEFGGLHSGGKCKETNALQSTAWHSIEALEFTIPLSNEQNEEKETFGNNCAGLKQQMQALTGQVSAWYNEDPTKRSKDVIKELETTFKKEISSIEKCLQDEMNGFNYEYKRDGSVHPKLKWRSSTISLKKHLENAQTALDSARQAFESAKKAAGASPEIKEQYNKCNELYTELMTQQSEFASKITSITIDESWSDKTAMEAKKSEAEKALNEYNIKLTGLQTALTAALGEELSDAEKKAALTNVKQELEKAQKELNENINKTVSDFEGAVTEAQKKAQEAAKIAKIPQELAVKNKEIGQKVGRGTQKLNSASWTQFGKVDKAVRKLVDIILNNPSKSLNELIQEENSKIVPAYEDVCKEYDKLQELSPAVSSSQSHSGSHQQSPQTSQTSSYSKMKQSSVSAPTSPSRGRGKVAPGRYTLRESEAVRTGKRKSIHDLSPKRPSRRR